MRPNPSAFRVLITLGVCLGLVACSSSPKRPSKAPVSDVTPSVMDEAVRAQLELVAAMRARQIADAPPTFTLPGVYRPVLVDGQMVLRKETDPKLIAGNYAVVLVDPSRGDISHQPGLMPAELAREVVILKQAQAKQVEIATALVSGVNMVGQQAGQLAAQIEATRAANTALAAEVARLQAEAKANPAPAAAPSGSEGAGAGKATSRKP